MDKEVIKKLLLATGVKKGELILLHFWGEEEQRQILHDFEIQVASLGASPISVIQSRSVNRVLFSEASEGCFEEKYFSLFQQVDAVIDLFAYQPVVLGGDLSEDAMIRYKKYMSSLFGTLMKAKRFTQLRIPTQENAKDFQMNPEEFIERMSAAYDVDYDAIRARGEELVKEFSATKTIVLHTGDGEELSISYENREWFVDAGDGDLPCGEIYIAPIEDKTEGTIYFEQFYLEDLPMCKEVILIVQDGRIVSANHPVVREFLATLPESGKVVCEFGLGLNPNIKSLCGCAVLDEKMEGTVHIAIGANHMFGGVNEAPMHLDLVTKAEITKE